MFVDGTAALFLLAMALLNLFILFNVWRHFALEVTRGESVRAHDEAIPGGLMTRIFSAYVSFIITSSWYMYFVGFLFGLGFDTAN